MSTRQVLCAGLATLAFGLTALAQAPAATAPAQDRPGLRQPGAPDGRGQSDRWMARGMDPARVIERLNKDLKLSDEQQEKIRKLLTEHREKLMEYQRSPEAQENREKARDLFLQLQAARRADDQEKTRELGAKLRELMETSRMVESRQKLAADIEDVLTPEQRKKFEPIRTELFGARLLITRPEMLRQAVASLTLPAEKQQAIDAIMKSAQAKADKVEDPREKRRIVEEMYNKVLAELTPEQQEKLKAWRPQRVRAGDGDGDRPQRRHERRGRDNGPSQPPPQQ